MTPTSTTDSRFTRDGMPKAFVGQAVITEEHTHRLEELRESLIHLTEADDLDPGVAAILKILTREVAAIRGGCTALPVVIEQNSESLAGFLASAETTAK